MTILYEYYNNKYEYYNNKETLIQVPFYLN